MPKNIKNINKTNKRAHTRAHARKRTRAHARAHTHIHIYISTVSFHNNKQEDCKQRGCLPGGKLTTQKIRLLRAPRTVRKLTIRLTTLDAKRYKSSRSSFIVKCP